jgi:heme/copper-type cytochrome/quinol oxidase subunit 3
MNSPTARWTSRGQDGAAAITAQWPPKGLTVIDPFSLPLLNTLILLCRAPRSPGRTMR